jgi:hypothetical protein
MKLTYEQRQQIRQQIREERQRMEDSLDEDSLEELYAQESNTLTRKDAKNIFKQEEDEYNVSNAEKARERKQVKKSFKNQERQKAKVEISWNISVGDAVTFDRSGEECFGMVIEQRADGKYRNAREAKYRGYVLVMSSAGRHWMNPRELTVIED